MPRVNVHINGIMNFPGSAKNWTGKAVTFTHVNSDRRAEKCEYLCGPIDRIFGQTERADKLFATVNRYHGWDIDIIGHSNGCDVICDMLKAHPGCPRIGTLHMVCGACEADFEKNGLNEALRIGKVGRVVVYCAGQDKALALAHTLPGRILGYGVLGLHGPVNVAPSFRERVQTETDGWEDFGHSDCWSDEHFDQTMKLFLG